MSSDNAVAAGWNPDDGPAPFVHGTPPEDEPTTPGSNGLPRMGVLAVARPMSLGGYVSWPDVQIEMNKQVGFVEGPHNQNPWGPEQGVSNASYCNSFADIIPVHHGYKWWPECQFGVKGNAYVPLSVRIAIAHGEWRFDHSSSGDPCDLVPGDQTVFVWPGGDKAGDHIETVFASYPDFTFLTCGANTGKPEGVHLVHRDRKYLLGRIRPVLYADPNPPQPPGGSVPGYAFHTNTLDHVDWQKIRLPDGREWSWILMADGATYAGPDSPAIPGVNGKDYWVSPNHAAGPLSAIKLHVRLENGVAVDTIEDKDKNLFRPDGGPGFRTH